jgi:hypothetical protein
MPVKITTDDGHVSQWTDGAMEVSQIVFAGAGGWWNGHVVRSSEKVVNRGDGKGRPRSDQADHFRVSRPDFPRLLPMSVVLYPQYS